jgi:peptidoglycan/LPS O-acetylase OafA/YrhL
MNSDTSYYGELPKLSRSNNMGAVRYYLALAVVVAHFSTVMGVDIPWPTSSYNAVGGFFALSGFLVYGSYLRAGSLRAYVARRARRILPPYLFIVLLCAFLLAALSSLSPAEYFSSPQWWRYLLANLTFMNFLGPDLPGVFTDHVSTAVNGSLWTIKVEWMLYLSVPLVALLIRRLRRPALLTFAAIYIFSMLYRLGFLYLYETRGSEIWNILSRQVFGQLMYFYTGVAIYFRLAAFMRYRWQLLAAALLLTLLGDYIPCYDYTLGPIAVSILVLRFSLAGTDASLGIGAADACSSPASRLSSFFQCFNTDNISYDIYLVHLPVIQVVACFAPGILSLFGLNASGAAGLCALFILSFVAILILASISWFLIGKRWLKR